MSDTWMPMAVCPSEVGREIIVVAFFETKPQLVAVFRVNRGEYDAFFEDDYNLSLHEQGWLPFAWRDDDTPARDDDLFPPQWTDCLTSADV